MTTITTHSHAIISSTYLIQKIKQCMQSGVCILKKICREKLVYKLDILCGFDNPQETVENLFISPSSALIKCDLHSNNLQYKSQGQRCCSYGEINISHFASCIPAKWICKQSIYSILSHLQYSDCVVWFGLGFFSFPSPASLELSLLA